MHRERLEHLITILEAVDPEHYDQTRWVCRSAACAGGYAAQDAGFNKLGLTLSAASPRFGGYLGIDALQRFFDLSPKAADYIFGSVSYYRLSRALADEADDDTEDDEEVCGRYIKPSHVIARIEEILA